MNSVPIKLTGLKRLLIVKPDEVGDVVLAGAFLRELRKNCPGAWISLVVNPRALNLVELCPYVDEVITYEWRVSCDWRVGSGAGVIRRRARILYMAARHLWKRRFELAVFPRSGFDYYNGGDVMRYSRAPIRVGCRRSGHDACVGTLKRRGPFTHVFDDPALIHEVEKNLGLIGFLGGRVTDDSLEVWLSNEDRAAAGRILGAAASYGSALIAVGMGARAPNRSWPKERFLELIEWLLRRGGECTVALMGGTDEESPAGFVEDSLAADLRPRLVNLTGRTTLRQAAAVLERCRIFIGNDSGLMHVAAAAKTPVVEISGWPASGSAFSDRCPHRFGPWGIRHEVVNPRQALSPCKDECSRRFPHCIAQITLSSLQEAVSKILC